MADEIKKNRIDDKRAPGPLQWDGEGAGEAAAQAEQAGTPAPSAEVVRINPWMQVEGDYLYISRCNWLYPHATEDEAGPRDEQRAAALEFCDGDICLSFRGGACDAAHVATMLETLWGAPSAGLEVARASAAAIASQSQAAQPTVDPNNEAEISRELLEVARGTGDDYLRGLLQRAASEATRFYGGMMAWKQTAQKKDRDWNAERMGRVNDRIAERASQATKAQADDDLAAKLNAAVDAEYPVPDSPHTSVIQRAVDNRAAMWRGINAARKILAAATKAQAEPIYQEMCGEFGEHWGDTDKAGYDAANKEGITTRIVYAAPVAKEAPALTSNAVTRESALVAIGYVDASNSPGRKREAVAMLEPVASVAKEATPILSVDEYTDEMERIALSCLRFGPEGHRFVPSEALAKFYYTYIAKEVEQAHVMPPFAAPAGQHDDDFADVFDFPKARLKREDWDPVTRKPKVSPEKPQSAGSARVGGNTNAESFENSDIAPTTSTVSAPTGKWSIHRLHDMGTVSDERGEMVAQTYFNTAKAFMEAHNASIAAPSSTEGAQAAPTDAVLLDFLDGWVKENEANGHHWFNFAFDTHQSAREQIKAEMTLRTSTDQANADTGSAE